MNKIYKVVKNQRTHVSVAVSELATGKGRHKRALLAGSFLLSLGLVPYAVSASDLTVTPYQPGKDYNNNKQGAYSITAGSQTILDLSQGQGYEAIGSGREADDIIVSPDKSITTLYNEFYVKPRELDNAVSNATNQATLLTGAKNQAEQALTVAQNILATKEQALLRLVTGTAEYEAAQEEVNLAKENVNNQTATVSTLTEQLTAAQNQVISATSAASEYSQQLKTRKETGDNFEVLSGKAALLEGNTGATNLTIKTDYATYVDPITGSTFEIKKNSYNESTSGLQDIQPQLVLYKAIPETSQYRDMRIATVDGADASLTITSSGNNDAQNNLNVHAKNTSVYEVKNGATLNYSANTQYHLGNNQDEAILYEEGKSNILNSTASLSPVSYSATTIVADWGKTYTINSINDVNSYNNDLLNYIKTDTSVRLANSGDGEMQRYYETQIQKLHDAIGVKTGESVDYKYTFSASDIAKVKNELVAEGDVSLDSTHNNNFILASGDHTQINVSGVINSTDSNGTIIRVEGAGTGRTINVTGSVLSGGNAKAIDATQTDIDVAQGAKVAGGGKTQYWADQ